MQKVKDILNIFVDVDGVKINYHKSILVPIKVQDNRIQPLIQILQCQQGSFPFIYVALPLHFNKLITEDIIHILQRIIPSYWTKGGLVAP